MKKKEQILLVVIHYKLTIGKGKNPIFTVSDIYNNYGGKFINWKTNSSETKKLLSSTFYSLTKDGYLNNIGKRGSENTYKINNQKIQNSIDFFHKLMEEIRDEENNNNISILSSTLKDNLIHYETEEIYEESENHYIDMDINELKKLIYQETSII